MSLPKINEEIVLLIDALGSHGEGIGRYHGYTVFVAGALPEEKVRVRIAKAHKRYAKAILLEILESSPNRAEPACPLFGTCGGCQLMHLKYSKQLETKTLRVKDALLRIGGIHDAEVNPCLASPDKLSYRNKIQLPAGNEKEGLELGLYAASSHNLVPISECKIHCKIGDEVFLGVKEILREASIKAYDPLTGQGELKHLLIKSAIYKNQVLIVFVTATKDQTWLLPVAEKIMQRLSSVKGVVQNINPEKGNAILGPVYKNVLGANFLHEQLGDLTFKVSPASFFQVNPGQAVLLYKKAIELARLSGDETLLDAYCGVGTLSLFFARHAKRVIGVECVPEAIRDAKENALLNGITNVSFFTAATEDFIGSLSAIDVVVLNPPRKGCDPIVIKAIGNLRPKKVVYISCDPATLARDLSELKLYGYNIVIVQPFDMFPQTAHVECVVSLQLPSS